MISYTSFTNLFINTGLARRYALYTPSITIIIIIVIIKSFHTQTEWSHKPSNSFFEAFSTITVSKLTILTSIITGLTIYFITLSIEKS